MQYGVPGDEFSVRYNNWLPENEKRRTEVDER